MINTYNKTIIEDTFNCEYSEERFKKFIRDLLPTANFDKEQMIQPLPNEYKDFIRSAKRICKYEYSTSDFDENVLDVLVVKLKKASSVDRARTAQRNFVARYLNGSRNYQKDAALVAFISEDENENISPDWRFSLIEMNYVTEIVEDAKGGKKRKTSVELTPAKRFSFLVGKNEDTHTAQTQLYACLEKATQGEKTTLDDLIKAFDIEKVSKEFFDKYKKLYEKLKAELERLYNADGKIKDDFDKHNINIDDFAKKTLGQLVFLYFIQKKGWLGVPRDGVWGQGDKRFLRDLFDKDEKFNAKYDNFFNDVLEHLFYEALALDRTNTNDLYEPLNCRIPFLNGGLFEPINGYEYQKTDLNIDNNIFKEIFATFDLYNFTVKEDEPLEKEVAIDPEMLGKVFENLLPENIRKGNGAFYTPREIVHYMCQESLINYLYNKVNTKEIPISEEEKQKQLALFKKKKMQEQLKLTQEVFEEIVSKEDISILIKKGDSTYSNKSRKIDETLPTSIIEKASLLDSALANIKICDPAIGSGAFPVGMMNEVVRARAALSEHIGQSGRLIYSLKRNAIENSIYGVDIDAGAVEIAKLRFWLSLVVDEDNVQKIKPLPNLDYKIMQGNSLITSYEDIDFDEIVENYVPVLGRQIGLFEQKSESVITSLKHCLTDFLNTPHSTRKGEIKQEIENLIVELVKTKMEEKISKLTDKAKSEINIEEKIRNFTQNKENRNFFPWKLFFADAFETGGFDIVIGNPPYVSTKGVSINDKKFYEKEFGFSDDTYNLFFFKGYSILQDKGVLTYITPKTFWTTQTKRNLRDLLLSQKINYIFDTANPFEAAMVDTCVTSITNIMSEIEATTKNKILKLFKQHYYNDAIKMMLGYSKKLIDENYLEFLDGTVSLLEPEQYRILQKTFLNTQNSVIFKPTQRNMRICELYGEKVKELYDKWWDKIETSKKISQNKAELEKYRASLKPGDIALLGCLTEGGQGLATANNGKYIAVRKSTKWANNILQSRPKKLEEVMKKYKISSAELDNLSVSKFLLKSSEREIAQKFDKLKEKYGRDIFGQGYIYRIIEDEEIANVDSLTSDEKENGIDISKKYYVPYDKGDKDGNRWYLETPFAIAWSKENVHFLKTDPKARYQGYGFFFREGFCWNNILNPNARLLKAKLKKASVNDVGSMSLMTQNKNYPNYYFVTLLNSNILFDYYREFINCTVNVQINDIRKLPIIIPTVESLEKLLLIFNKIIKLKQATSLCKEDLIFIQENEKILDCFVDNLYGI